MEIKIVEKVLGANDAMAAQPRDPFLHRLIHNLAFWDRWFVVKYATVMFSTGGCGPCVDQV